MAPIDQQFSSAASRPPTTASTTMTSRGTNATSNDAFKSTHSAPIQSATKTTDASTFSTSTINVHQTSSATTKIPLRSSEVSVSSGEILRSTFPVSTQTSHPLSVSSRSTTRIQSTSPPLTPPPISNTGVHAASQSPAATIRTTTQSATRSSTRPALTTVDVSQTPGWMRSNRSQVPYATQSQQGVSEPSGGGTSTSTIVAGVLVPLILIGVGALIIYIWYRRKYPVRMVIGKDFSKFSNPMYNKRASTLTLVRNDAEQEWERINSLSMRTPELSVVSEEPEGHDNKAYVEDNHHENAEIKENEMEVVVVEQIAEENEISDEKVDVKLITRERPKTKKAVLVKTEETDDFSENGFELVTEDDLGVRTESELSSGNDSTETHTISLTFSETFDDRHKVQLSENGKTIDTNERNFQKIDDVNGDVSNEIKEISGKEELSVEETLSAGNTESFQIILHEHSDVKLETNQDSLPDQEDQPQLSLGELEQIEQNEERATSEILPIKESTTKKLKSIIPDNGDTTDGLQDPSNDEAPLHILSNNDMNESFEILNNSNQDDSVDDNVGEAMDFSDSNNSEHQSTEEIELDKALNKTPTAETNTAIEHQDVNDIVEKERVETLEKDQQRTKELSLSDSEDQPDSKMTQKEKTKSKSLDSINDSLRGFGIVKRSPLTSNENIVLEAETPTVLVQDSIIFESENLSPVVLDNTHVSPVRGRRAFTLNDIHFKKSPSFVAFDNSGLTDDKEHKSKSSPEIYGKDKTGDEGLVLKLSGHELETGSKTFIRTDQNVETEHIDIFYSSTNKRDEQKDALFDEISIVDAGKAEVKNKNTDHKEAINIDEFNEDMKTNQFMSSSFVSQDHSFQSFQSDDSDIEQNLNSDEQHSNTSQQRTVKHDEYIIANTSIHHFFENIEGGQPRTEEAKEETNVKQTENEMFTSAGYLEGDLFSTPFLKSSTPTASWVHEQSENNEAAESLDEHDPREIGVSKELAKVTTRKKLFAPLLDLNKFDDDEDVDDKESENESESSSETSQFGLMQSFNESDNSSKNSNSLISLDALNSRDNKAENDVIIGNINKSTDSSSGLSWEVIKELRQESRTSSASDLSDNTQYITDFGENNVLSLKAETTVSLPVSKIHLESSPDSAVNQNASHGNSTDVSWDFISEEGDNSEC